MTPTPPQAGERAAFTREQLQHFADKAADKAEIDAAVAYPEGREREECARRLQSIYYAQYVTP